VNVGMAAVQFVVECLLCVLGDNHKKNNQSKAFVVKYCKLPDWRLYISVNRGFVTFSFVQHHEFAIYLQVKRNL
jgi:hypothetical protein